MKIMFRLPAGVLRFKDWREYTEAELVRRFYQDGLETTVDTDQRAPMLGESVYLPGGEGFNFAVHSVTHYYGPRSPEDEPFEPYVFVVLR